MFYFMNTHVYLHKIRDDVIKTTCFSRELRVKVTEDQLRVFLDSLCMKKIRGNRKKMLLEKKTEKTETEKLSIKLLYKIIFLYFFLG